MAEYDSVFSAASQLTVDERLWLIDHLAATVPAARPPTLSLEWISELERRSNEIDSQQVRLESWEKVRQQLFKKVGADRAD